MILKKIIVMNIDLKHLQDLKVYESSKKMCELKIVYWIKAIAVS